MVKCRFDPVPLALVTVPMYLWWIVHLLEISFVCSTFMGAVTKASSSKSSDMTDT